jgi:uridine kinase
VISVLEQYNKFVKNAFRDFILPYMVYADIIIPGFRNNRVSVDFIVQHIKNMARRITFKERAVKTRTFIFGESEIYDLECSGSYDTTVSVEQESFLVFPTENEHKRELEFFLTSLLSEIFTVDYFH